MKIIILKSFLLLLVLNISCKSNHKREYLQGIVNKNILRIENKFIAAEWKINSNSIEFEKIHNKLDSTKIDTKGITLFKIHLKDKVLTNSDFELISTPHLLSMSLTDTLPTYALKEKGLKLITTLENKENQIQIKWSATLREDNHYIRQKIEVLSLKNNIYIEKITLLDGPLGNAVISGNVLGSPIVADNYFFGYEHPTVHSNLLKKKMLHYFYFTDVLEKEKNETSVLNIEVASSDLQTGAFTINYLPDNITSKFNIHKITLLENGNVISEDKHDIYGVVSKPDYKLNLSSKKENAKYVLEVELSNTKSCAGQFFQIQETKGRLNFYTKKELFLKPGKQFNESCIIGVCEEGQMRRSFLNYIERERAKPYSQFLHYNSWYDLSEDNVSYNLEQAKEVVINWGEKFIKPYNIDFGGFALDDGWDDLNDLWRFNKEDFPNSFIPLAEEAKKHNTGIGAWMSPFGGYAEPKKKRVATAIRDGFKTTDKGLSLAGPKYYQRFLESALILIKENEVNYFKFDGFGGSDPKYLPEMEAATKLVKTLRQEKPDVFINVTTGTWPSPFWLLTTDCTWRGGWDMQQAGVGNVSQKWITYRDGALYNNVIRRAPLYPLNSIMHHGIVYANRSHGKNYITDSDKDFADQVFSYFGSGTSLQELYISHDRMNKSKWDILAKGAKWAKVNESVLVDTHWEGGDPYNLDIYGWASWNGKKGIVTLRNPSDKEQTYKLDINKALEVNQFDTQYHISEPFINSVSNFKAVNGCAILTLKPFEVKVLEVVKE